MTLGYGARAAAGEVCFAVRPADGTDGTLWWRCVAPAGGEVAAEEVTLDVPDGTDELVLGAACAGGCGAGGPYWAKPAGPKAEAD